MYWNKSIEQLTNTITAPENALIIRDKAAFSNHEKVPALVAMVTLSYHAKQSNWKLHFDSISYFFILLLMKSHAEDNKHGMQKIRRDGALEVGPLRLHIMYAAISIVFPFTTFCFPFLANKNKTWYKLSKKESPKTFQLVKGCMVGDFLIIYTYHTEHKHQTSFHKGVYKFFLISNKGAYKLMHSPHRMRLSIHEKNAHCNNITY